jgi:hypothetical protein
MPQTNEVLELTQLIGPFYEFVDDAATTPSKSMSRAKSNHSDTMVNGIGEIETWYRTSIDS